MSCQQASRVQEDPYAFTEPAPLPANTSLYKQHPTSAAAAIVTTTGSSSSSSGTVSVTSSPPVIQAGASLLNSNNVGRIVSSQNAVQQRTLLGTSKVAPIKVTLVQSPSGVLSKARLNGTATITNSPAGTVFRTVNVPHATTIVQRPAGTTVAASSASASSPTVFTKPMQVQLSPQQMGKLSRRVLASKSPNVSPVAAGTAIQTVRIVKTTTAASPQQLQQQQKQLPPGGRPSITPDARRYLNHSNSNNNSLLVAAPSATTPATSTPAANQPTQLPAISPTKIRLIQPQSQGKIFLHTPNSSGNSLATATHISNPVSIAALRSTLAKQNPSLLAKIPPSAAVTAAASPSTVLPATVKSNTVTTPTAAINIRRAIVQSPQQQHQQQQQKPPIRQTSLETATTTVAPPPPSRVASVSPVTLAQPVPTVPAPSVASPPATAALKPTIQIPQTIIPQRSRTPTQSLLKPQLPRPTPAPAVPPPAPAPSIAVPIQDDIGFTIPSFIIPKQQQKELIKQEPVDVLKPQFQPPTIPAPTTVAPPPPPTTCIVPQAPKAKSKDTPSGKQRNKRSYSRSSHHETLERIPPIKDDPDGPNHEPIKPPPPPPVRFPKWKPPGAVVVPLRREWHAPDSYVFDTCAPGSADHDSLELAPATQDFWFEETYASSELDAEDATAALGGGMRPPAARKNRKGPHEDMTAVQSTTKMLLNLDDSGAGVGGGGELVALSRDERLELKRSYLRRKAVQSWNGQRLRDAEPARKRLKSVEKLLGKLDRQRETMLLKNGGVEQAKCQRPGCGKVALAATKHCYQHITDNTEQRLFQQCTAKFSDNSQCRVPVFDISHELILCREHAWKHDNHDKMSAEVKLLKKPGGGAVAMAGVGTKKPKTPKAPTIKAVPAAPAIVAGGKVTKNKKKKKLTPFQQQMALHQQQYKQQYSSMAHSLKPVTTVLPPPYSQKNHVPQQSLIRPLTQNKYQPIAHPTSVGTPVQIVPPPPATTTINRNIHIPLNHAQHMIGRNEDLMLNYAQQPQQLQHPQQQQQQPSQQFNQQQVQQILGSTQDLLNICENSSAYASSEDTGVGGLSESELMAAHDVIEEIPFEIGNLNNVLSQLPPDAFNELLFSEQEQNGPTFESTQEEEEDLERALEVVGEHVKSLEDMTVESANLFGDFLDNVDDEMLDGSDICSDQMLQSPGGANDIRGLVHT